MDFPQEGESIYYRLQAAFSRDLYGNLLHCTGSQEARIRRNWHTISPELCTWSGTLYQSSNASFTGIVLDNIPDPTHGKREFEAFFSRLLLRQANFAISYQSSSPDPSDLYTELVTEELVSLFDTYLRYQGEDDKWRDSGRGYFKERVYHFTSQGRRLELCLPAFPCKSSNTDKVTGKDPDRGEELALERLHGFVEAVEAIYSAGAKLWIISDGHVFSDCIGVNDKDVDAYCQKLIKMNREIGFRRGNTDRVGFKSLVDLFELEKYNSSLKLAKIDSFDIPVINHHVQTWITTEAELCRRLLMAGCQSQKSALRARIESQEAGVLALYRGFSRFMLEDLELHPFTRTMSRSKQKKLASKVAFEMIMRNQAYSNLVELLFPNHIRLSIHAHNNAGPKFGVQLFDPKLVRAIESLSQNSSSVTSLDLLHIPTPWHNCVAKVAGSEVLYVTKAKVVREALARGEMVGKLVTQEDRFDPSRGVYFALHDASHSGIDIRMREAIKREKICLEPSKSDKSRKGCTS
ncbi:Pyoverdine/dityrosine biosynthesis protein-domain-containing protein [Daldinia caldariorum]|uniref:Pyoverdine/dityrosine biosynthesis protein-domain-containing protein n=1 Tax=Daldinia caldariorum TaxID=326644 RepID=UPI0020089D1B|nr:Pyoverdine/dityrosine biosynthesis protein-domain-containing protein [Daldinia caldariorum]KAI1464293.1 Pyoverdine/dityrosine biosynthesis protein-domain-containing protein [Daldinia caldariorum]